MSRYRKASYNEQELGEVDGIKPILRPTRDEKLEVINLFFEQQKNKGLDLLKAQKVISNLLYNSMFLWENNKRTDKKEAGDEDITKDDIEAYVVDNIFELWLEILNALKIIDKKKLAELQEQQQAQLKAEQEKELTNPN